MIVIAGTVYSGHGIYPVRVIRNTHHTKYTHYTDGRGPSAVVLHVIRGLGRMTGKKKEGRGKSR